MHTSYAIYKTKLCKMRSDLENVCLQNVLGIYSHY